MAEVEPSLPAEREPVARRAARAAESILENESLTGDLDDASAEPLLDWGIACAQAIASDTGDLDDAQAEEAMVPRLRALRRLMRAVNQWVAYRQELDPDSHDALLAQAVEQAAVVYGARLPPLTEERWAAFLQRLEQLADAPAQTVMGLRELFEREETSPSEPMVDDEC